MDSILLPVEDASHTAETRRTARGLANALGFEEAGVERVAIAVSEACTNLLKHAGGGQIFLGAVDHRRLPLLEILALDRGPGMADTGLCTRDGFSTAGTLGHGLGAIDRMAAFWDIYSQAGRGTALLARISSDSRFRTREVRTYGLQAPMRGQEVCGDAWCVLERDEARTTLMIADGLGHGPEAAQAARTAVSIAQQQSGGSPKDLLEIVNLGLRHTRGAAVGIAELDREHNVVVFATIGNIGGRICEPGKPARQMVSMDGTAGVQTRNSIREFRYPWPDGSVVILHSDGLVSRWDLNEYAGLLSRDPGLIAGVIFRDYRRLNDDSSVLVAK